MAYKHGAYGELSNSNAQAAKQSDVVAVYIGYAPIHLIRGWKSKNLVNTPIKVSSMSEVQSKLGFTTGFGVYTLCEAFAQHFDNTVGNVGPIYVINVLDPGVHKVETTGEKREITFVNGRYEEKANEIILDSIAFDGWAENVDYTLRYDFAKESIILEVLGDEKNVTKEASMEYIDTTKLSESDIIGEATEDGQYKGLHALKLLYQEHNAVLGMLAAPKYSEIPEVYRAMVSIVQKLNGHWDGFVNADIPLSDANGPIDTIAKAIAWKEANGYTSEFSKVYWPQVKDASGRTVHLSTVGQATMQRVDLGHDGVPFESPSNKEIMATRQYFGFNPKNKGFDQQTCNALNEKGITTACFWGGRWVLWGPHTAAYSYNGNMDARAIFDVNIRMLLYITNSFQIDHGTEIDSPMTPQDKETILNAEREKLDTLLGIGALIGTPTVEFLETENPESDMMNGDFVWDFKVTNTPPFKSGTARVRYTDEGFASFFEAE